eukprot:IDg8965t1
MLALSSVRGIKNIHTVAAALKPDGDKDDTGKNLESQLPDLNSAASTT